MNFQNNLRILRKLKKVSYAEIARSTGLSKSYVWEMENNNRIPTIETILKLAKFFDVSIEQLYVEELKETDLLIIRTDYPLLSLLKELDKNNLTRIIAITKCFIDLQKQGK